MTYVVSPVDTTTPADTDDISEGAQEFRLLKGYIQTNIMSVINTYGNPAGTNAAVLIFGAQTFE